MSEPMGSGVLDDIQMFGNKASLGGLGAFVAVWTRDDDRNDVAVHGANDPDFRCGSESTRSRHWREDWKGAALKMGMLHCWALFSVMIAAGGMMSCSRQ